MQSLTVVGRENDLLIVVNEAGERFTITIDQALVDQVRRTPSVARPGRQQTSPKDIQAHIRRGLGAQQVADLTGEDISYVQRFEGPVLAERDYVVEQARQMLVSPHGDDNTTFGDLVNRKLEELSSRDASWTAWKEDTGWRVEVTFFEGEVEHKAQWAFDQRKHTLTPLNGDAEVLSTNEPIRGPLIPKLRAVPAASTNDEHFEADVFGDMPLEHTGPLLEPVAYGRTNGLTDPDEDPDDNDDVTPSNTADLLEVLRKRRGEREPAPDHDSDTSRSAHPSTGSIRLVDPDDDSHQGASIHALPGSDTDDDPDTDPDDDKPTGSKKNRPEMPSWDDIVFGTRSDDDPA